MSCVYMDSVVDMLCATWPTDHRHDAHACPQAERSSHVHGHQQNLQAMWLISQATTQSSHPPTPPTSTQAHSAPRNPRLPCVCWSSHMRPPASPQHSIGAVACTAASSWRTACSACCTALAV